MLSCLRRTAQLNGTHSNAQTPKGSNFAEFGFTAPAQPVCDAQVEGYTTIVNSKQVEGNLAAIAAKCSSDPDCKEFSPDGWLRKLNGSTSNEAGCVYKKTQQGKCFQLKCLDGPAHHAKDGTAYCQKGFRAVPCPADNCEGVHCQNGGSCVGGKCECKPGFTGENCQTEKACDGVMCPEGRVCQQGKCGCPNGFIGSSCQQGITNMVDLITDKTNVINQMYMPSAEACQKACGEDSSCQAWTHNQECMLGDDLKHKFPHPYHSTGLKGAKDIEQQAFRSRRYIQFVGKSQEFCRQACENDDACKTWSHYGSCKTLRTQGKPEPANHDVSSGLK